MHRWTAAELAAEDCEPGLRLAARTARSPTTGGGGTRPAYAPMFLARLAEADILGICDMHV